MWTKGGDIKFPDNPIFLALMFFSLIIILFCCFWIDMSTREQNIKFVENITSNKKTEIFLLKEDFAIPYVSFVTGGHMSFVINKGSLMKKLNDKCLLVFQEEIPKEIESKYGVGKENGGYIVVLTGIQNLVKTSKNFKSAKFSIHKK